MGTRRSATSWSQCCWRRIRRKTSRPLARNRLGRLIDVLGAMREQDTRLEEIIRDQQISKGRGEVFNPRAFRERVQVLGPVVSLDVLQRTSVASS